MCCKNCAVDEEGEGTFYCKPCIAKNVIEVAGNETKPSWPGKKLLECLAAVDKKKEDPGEGGSEEHEHWWNSKLVSDFESIALVVDHDDFDFRQTYTYTHTHAHKQNKQEENKNRQGRKTMSNMDVYGQESNSERIWTKK